MKWPWTKILDRIEAKYASRTTHLNSIESMRFEQEGCARRHLDERLDRIESAIGMLSARMEPMGVEGVFHNANAKKQRKTRGGKK